MSTGSLAEKNGNPTYVGCEFCRYGIIGMPSYRTEHSLYEEWHFAVEAGVAKICDCPAGQRAAIFLAEVGESIRNDPFYQRPAIAVRISGGKPTQVTDPETGKPWTMYEATKSEVLAQLQTKPKRPTARVYGSAEEQTSTGSRPESNPGSASRVAPELLQASLSME